MKPKPHGRAKPRRTNSKRQSAAGRKPPVRRQIQNKTDRQSRLSVFCRRCFLCHAAAFCALPLPPVLFVATQSQQTESKEAPAKAERSASRDRKPPSDSTIRTPKNPDNSFSAFQGKRPCNSLSFSAFAIAILLHCESYPFGGQNISFRIPKVILSECETIANEKRWEKSGQLKSPPSPPKGEDVSMLMSGFVYTSENPHTLISTSTSPSGRAWREFTYYFFTNFRPFWMTTPLKSLPTR